MLQPSDTSRTLIELIPCDRLTSYGNHSHQAFVHREDNETDNRHYQEGAAPFQVMDVQEGNGRNQAF